MHTENFLELLLKSNKYVSVAKSSIASIEEVNNTTTLVTMKETRQDGTQICYEALATYLQLKTEINKFEKTAP